MDEFQPEDELKPDASDRPAARTRKSSPKPKLPKLPQLPQLPVSKQHIMIAVGILVLLLLILGIGAALKGPSQSPVTGNNASSGGEGKSIDLSGSSVMSNTPGATSDAPPPPVAGSDTEGDPASPSDMSSASPSAPSSAPVAPAQPDAAQSGVSTDGTATPPVASQTTLPTAPATLGLSGKNTGMASGNRSANTSPSLPASVPSVPHHAVRKSPASERNVAAERREREARLTEQRRREEQRRVTEQRRVAEQRRAAEPRRVAEHPVKEPRKPVTVSEPVRHESKPATEARKTSPEAVAQVPSGEYTIQLSGATHRESLNAWARQQNLTGYHVYETQRNGQPWYVLVSGSYATSAEAKRAISTLPDAVRAKSPWVKPLSQVRKEAAK